MSAGYNSVSGTTVSTGASTSGTAASGTAVAETVYVTLSLGAASVAGAFYVINDAAIASAKYSAIIFNLIS